MKDRILLDVIATFANGPQDLFSIYFDSNKQKKHLKSENDLLNHLQNIIDYPKDSNLKKLSLCFYCKRTDVKKYPAIQKVISNNGKYFFEDNEKLPLNKISAVVKEDVFDEMLKESDWNNDELVSSAINKVKRTIH